MAAQAEASILLTLIDKVTGPIRRIGDKLGNLSKRIGVDRIGRSIGNLGNRFKGLGDGIARTTGRLTALMGVLGAGGAGVIAGAFSLAKTVADLGGEIDDATHKLKIGSDALQEYRFVAKMSGVEVASFDKGVEKLGINAGEAAKGNKELSKAFKTLGVRVKNSKGQMRPMEDILDDTMLALTKIKDPLKQNSLAFKLFGKSGVELTKMMADGPAGIKKWREEMRKSGAMLGKDAVAAAADFGDAIDRLTTRLDGLKTFIGAQLLPVFTEVIDNLTDWYDANKVLIRSTITEWVQNLIGFIRDLADPTSKVRQYFADWTEKISDLMAKLKPFVDFIGGPMNAALALLGLWALAPVIAAITLLATAFGGLALSIAGVGIKTIGLAIKGMDSLFSGMAGTAQTAGTTAGTTYGNAFSKSLRGAVRLGLLGLGAYAASQIIGDMPTTKEGWTQRIKENEQKDAERNKAIMDNGGSSTNKLLGFDLFREKNDYEHSPAKRLLDGIKGMFSSSTPGGGEVSRSLAVNDAINARRFGVGGSTTDTLPGKAMDDAGVAAPAVTLPNNMIVHEPQQTTVNAPLNVGGIVVNVQGMTQGQAQAAMQGALRKAASEHAANVNSALSD